MSTARQLPDNKQGTGGLKLKIKFSKSKGFVSDFVGESHFSHASKHSVSTSSGPSISQPGFPEEQHTSPGFEQIPLNGSDHDHQHSLGRIRFVQKSLFPEANGSSTDSKPIDLSISQLSVNQCCQQDSTYDPQVDQVRSRSSVLDSDFSSVLLSVPFKEPVGDQPESPGSRTECVSHVSDGHDSGQAELSGINYGQMLQDLEFLSSQHDEPDSGGSYPPHRQSEQHLTAAGAPAQVSEPAMAGRDLRPRSGIGKEAEEGVQDLSQTVEVSDEEPVEVSDEEPMSPFDINCSLGFADDDFPFSTSNHKQGNDQDCIKSQPRENPLFPWSVVSSSEPCPRIAAGPARRNQFQTAGGLSALTNEKPIDLSTKGTVGKDSSSYSVNPGVAETECTLRRLIVVDCRGHRGTRLDYEINNNRNFPHFYGEASSLNHSPHPDPDNRRTELDHEINNNRNFPHFSAGSCTLDNSSHPDPGNLHSSYQSGGFTAVRKPALGKSCQASAAFPQPQQDQQKQCQSATNDLLRLLLSRKEKTPNALRDVCSVPNYASPLASTSHTTSVSQSRSGSLSAGTVPSQLNRTIDELRKRVEEMPATDLPSTSQNCGSSVSQTGSTPSVEKTAGSETQQNSPTKPQPMWQVWCRCAEPEPDTHLEEHEDLTGSSLSSQETCKKCFKKLSKRWKNITDRKRRAGHRVQKWCRCQPPDNSSHESDAKGVANVCRKCQLKVSKKWMKRIAVRWCKCRTPVLHTTWPMGTEEDNDCDNRSTCKMCWKWVSKEKEQFAHRGNLVGDKLRPSAGPQPFMADHNYSHSPFSRHAEHGELFHVSDPVGSENRLSAEAAQPQDTLDHNHQVQTLLPVQTYDLDSRKKIVYVFPPRSKLGKNLYAPLGRETETLVVQRGSNEQNCGMGLPNTLARVPPNMPPAVTVTSPLIPVPPTDLQIDCVTDPPSGSLFFTSGSSGAFASSSGEPVSAASVSAPKDPSSCAFANSSGECISAASVSNSKPPSEDADCTENGTKPKHRKATRRIYKQAKGPPFSHEVDQDIFQPCCVVMDKLPDDFRTRQVSANLMCSKSCRQQHLNFLCGMGQLQQCKRSFENRKTHEEQNAKRLSVWNKKRDLLRRNRTMDGYEEYRRKELQQKQERLVEQSTAPVVSDALNSSDAATFIPLSSLCSSGTTDVVISQEGVSIQQPTRKPRKQKLGSRHFLEAECGNHVVETATDKTEQGVEKKENAIEKKQPEVPDSSIINSDDYKQAFPEKPGGDNWIKVSKFNVKYYVFQCGNRAFVVPLIKENRNTRNVKRLDEEDLGYVTAVIGQLLVEKESCARLLGYPDSLQHKGLRRTITQNATSEEASSKKSKKAFVAPTLGAEDLDIEGLKSLISDKDFSRLVPQNSRLSKSKYLQQIGEKVHMYLTGGSEEAPEWIKDVAKSIVMKHRRRVQSRKRLKPSKDVIIEMDYAEEEELVDVGEEGTFPLQHSPVEGSTPVGYSVAVAAEDSSAAMNEGVDPTNLFHQEFAPEADYTFQQTGSYVCQEAYAQEEKKPLLGELVNAAQPVDTPTSGGNAPVLGQQIMVPLPQGCDYGQADTSALSASATSTSVASVPQQLAPETSVTESPTERKPLVGELLAPATSVEHAYDDHRDHCAPPPPFQGQQHSGELCQPSGPRQHDQQPGSAWPLVLVKEEPPDDDYSHAWPAGAQEGAGHSVDQEAEEQQAFPFISMSTFGNGVVQLEDEAGHAPDGSDQHIDHVPSTVVQPVVKMEPVDMQDNNVGVPLITCIASGEAASLLENSDDQKHSSGQRDGAADASRGETESHPHFSPQIMSVSFGEAVIHTAENCIDDVNSDSQETSVSAEELGNESLPAVDFDQEHTRQSKDCLRPFTNDAVAAGGVVSELVEGGRGELFDEDREKGTRTERKEADYRIEDANLPQISAVAFGEAAMLWENEGSAADSTEVAQAPHPAATVSECQPDIQPSVPVISSVAFGDAVTHLESETSHQLGQNMASPGWHQAEAAFHHDDDYAEKGETLYEEDENEELDSKPVVAGICEGRLISVPIIFSGGNPPASEAVAEPTVEPPQVCNGVDLSIVKQEPQDVEEPFTYSMGVPVHTDPSHYEAVPALDNESSETPAQDEHSPDNEASEAPTILDVRSLALLMPRAAKEFQREQKLQVANDIFGTPPEEPSLSRRTSMTSKSVRKSRNRHVFGSRRRKKTKALKLQLSWPEPVHVSEKAGISCLEENTALSRDTPLSPPDSSQPLSLPQLGEHVAASEGCVAASFDSSTVLSSIPLDLQPEEPVQRGSVFGVTTTNCLTSAGPLQSSEDLQKTKLPREGPADFVEHSAAPVRRTVVPSVDDTRAGNNGKREGSFHRVNDESSSVDAKVLQNTNMSKPKRKKRVKRRGSSKPRKKAAKPSSSLTSVALCAAAVQTGGSRNTPSKAGGTASSSAPLAPAASGEVDDSDVTPRVTRLASRASAELHSRTEVAPNTDALTFKATAETRKASTTSSSATGTWESSDFGETSATKPVPSTNASGSRLPAVVLPSCSAAGPSTSLEPLAKADEQRGVPATAQDTDLSDTRETSLPKRSVQSAAAPKSRQKRRRGGARLTLRKKRAAPSSTSQTAASRDRTLADDSADSDTDKTGGVRAGHPAEERDCPTATKRAKGDTVGVAVRPNNDPPAGAAPHATHQSLKRKSDQFNSDSAAGKSAGGKASVLRGERSVFSHMSAVLSKITPASPSSPVLPGSSKVVKAVEASDAGDGLFSRLQASTGPAREDAVKGDAVSGTRAPCARDGGPDHAKGARERSFFDCLPQDFLDAWKS